MIDMRRENAYQQRQLEKLQYFIGETIIWFRFDTANSEYHPVYDEANRQYLPGVQVPVMWIDQVEDPKQYGESGRRPTMRFRGAISARTAQEHGIPVDEVHGNRSWDTPPLPPGQEGRPASPWLDDRLNDVIYYDGRFWAISNYQIRGRTKDKDSIIGISAIEMSPEDEFPWDGFIWDEPTDQTVPLAP